MSKLIAPADVVWVHHPIIKMHDSPPPESQWEYKVWLPDWLAEWDVYGDWEVERFDSMRDNLKQGDILFDIGAELGWQSIIYAQFVGAENMVLVEPSPALWPNIKHTWQHNFPGIPPLACYAGLFSNKTTSTTTLAKNLYPASAKGSLVDAVAYRNIHEYAYNTPQITIDDFIQQTDFCPTALTIDVEGAELLVLQGAEEILSATDVKVWVSIHPELAEKNYKTKTKDIHKLMKSYGYKGKLLATDHEEHWYFTKAAV